MPDVVVDASVAAKWQLKDEAHVAEAERLLRTIESGAVRLVVPDFWRYEVAGLYTKAVANGRMGDVDALEALSDVLRIPAVRLPLPHPMDAFRAARRFNRSLIDCFYLAIAEERGCDFWSDDRKLCRALSPTYPFVRWIGDYAAAAPSPAE